MILTLLLLAHLHIIIKSACLPKPCYKDYSTLSYEQYQTSSFGNWPHFAYAALVFSDTILYLEEFVHNFRV